MILGFSLGPWEIAALVGIGLLLFGSRLPSIARSLGKSITEFKHGVKDVNEQVSAPAEPRKLEAPREVPAQRVEKAPAVREESDS